MKTPRILLVADGGPESEALRESLCHHARLIPAARMEDLRPLLETESFDAVLCDWSFEGGSWDRALREIRNIRPELPVIVYTPSAGAAQWLMAIEAGAFDLLAVPFEERLLFSALEQAASSHEARLLRLAPAV